MVDIRPLKAEYLDDLAELYTYYALNTVYTYYQKPADAPYMRDLLTGAGHSCSVILDGKRAIGYVHISPSHSIFQKKCTIAIYLDPNYTHRGYGQALCRYAETMAKQKGYHAIIAAICTENTASLALFARMGYRKTYLKEDACLKFNRLLSTQYCEKKLH